MQEQGIGTAFRDRSRGLLAYGWVLISCGVICGLFAALLVAAVTFTSSAAARIPTRATAYNAFFYVALGASFVALGVGSIRARRWAQALAVVVGWAWLATGVLMTLAALFVMPSAFASVGMPAGTVGCAVGAVALISLLFLILLPALLLLFYRREDVRRTVERRSPGPDWSDRLPRPILGVVAALVFGGIACLLTPLSTRAVPVFGRVVTGVPALVILIGTGVFCLLLSWMTWRRLPAAWWGLVLFHLAGIGNFLTLRSLDMRQFLRQSGYPEEQIRLSAKIGIMSSPGMLAIAAVSSAGLLVFLLTIRREFTGRLAPAQH